MTSALVGAKKQKQRVARIFWYTGGIRHFLGCHVCMNLKRDSCCEEYIDQLIPSSTPITKIKLKLFGSSAAGKTSLVESLKAGYLTGIFRRSRRSSSRHKERRGGYRNCINQR